MKYGQFILKMTKLLSFVASMLWFGTGLALAQECSKIVFTGPPVAAPSSWVNDRGQLTGAGVEYTRGVAREAGFDTVEFRVFPNWDHALQAVYAGDVDAVFSANWSIERTRFLDFVRPAMSSQFLNVVVRRGEGFPLNKFEDLIGRTGANSQGETYGEGMFSQFASERLNLHKAPSMSQVFDLLLQKQVDYILAFENTVYEQMMTRNLGSTVQILNTYPTQLEGFIAFSKRSKCSEAVRVKFSEAIARANSRKTYRLLMHKYREVFNENLTRPQ